MFGEGLLLALIKRVIVNIPAKSLALPSLCRTPMLAIPDDTPLHSYEAAMDLVAPVPNAQVTAYLWKEAPDIFASTIEQVRSFLQAHERVRADG